MKKKEAQKRKIDILKFIYRVKAVLPRHISSMFFKTQKRAWHYLLWLEKNKFLTSVYIHALDLENQRFRGLVREKAYFLTEEGMKLLRLELNKDTPKEKQKEFYKYKINLKELHHDLLVTDTLIWFLKNYKGIKGYMTDFEHRRAMNRRREWYRLPDYTFEDEDGHILVEYEHTKKAVSKIKKMVDDYKAYYKNYTKILIAGTDIFKDYEKILREENVKDCVLAIYTIKKGLKILKEFYKYNAPIEWKN